jgi:hypothetical protein
MLLCLLGPWRKMRLLTASPAPLRFWELSLIRHAKRFFIGLQHLMNACHSLRILMRGWLPALLI